MPRTVDQKEIDELKYLASLVMDQMELRLSARRAVSQAQLMAREIDHRVMNSLQFISSLLNMQSRLSKLPDGGDQLQMAASRVAAVARVHRNFYAGDAADVSCIEFLGRLCADLSGILGTQLDVHGDEGSVPTTSIQPIGLIVNELVSNAAKHGSGTIEVVYTTKDGKNELSVCDQGDGLPADFEPERSVKGLGMKVVAALASQLGGRMTVGVNPAGRGTCFRVSFPS
jgi:two-component sensor histidine kinase